MNEEKTVSANYIINFYTEVQNLTNHYAQYINFLVELEHLHGKDFNNKKISEEEKITITQAVQKVRFYCHKCYIQSNCILKGLKQQNKEIKPVYDKLKTEFIITRETIESFVIKMNEILVTEIIQSLLENSQEIINNIYDNPKPE